MRYVSTSEAKQHLRAVLEAAQDHPVTIRRKNRDVAVVLSIEAYDRLRGVTAPQNARVGLKQLLLQEAPRTEELTPPRQKHRQRAALDLD